MPDSFKSYVDEKNQNSHSPKQIPSDANVTKTDVPFVTTAIVQTMKLIPAVTEAFSNSKKSEEATLYEFSESTVSNDEFLQAVSDEIGVPREDESVDEFVERSMVKVRAMVRKKLRVEE